MDCTIFQSPEWEEFKLKTGYEKSYRIGNILVLQKRLPMGRAMLYAPLVGQYQVSGIKYHGFLEQIRRIAKDNNSIFFRFEINAPLNTRYKILDTGFVKAFEEMQPEHNWVLDITKSEEEILTGMKQKGRYNIKIAQSGGVEISSSNTTGRELDQFYKQYNATGKRHKIGFRNKEYFEALLEIFGQKDYARVYSTHKGKTALASAVILFYKKECLYLYGGSSDQERNLMAPYLLHWEIIKEAKKRGCEEYNFLGIAPDDNPRHPWAGITKFKKQFGGEQIDILGSYDLPLKPFEYKVFKIAEKIRRR